MTLTEHAAHGWRKATYSGAQDSCVEVGHAGLELVAVRDTKDRSGPVLSFGAAAWREFTDGLKAGDHS